MVAKPFSGKKVFVTGHTGFKGAWLCQWLNDLDADITGFSLPALPTSPCLFEQLDLARGMKDFRGDIRDAGAVRNALLEAQPDFVFHLAAQPLVRLSYEQPTETYQTNVLGTINVMEALRKLHKPCAAILVTTDKCYENRERLHAYCEEDPLGGYDPYSSSKAACEIAISSWRRSFFKDHPVRIASARAGNVIGGGDWALDRIVPDIVRCIGTDQAVAIRNPSATRPWQHVLEPLGGYLLLAAHIAAAIKIAESDETIFSTPQPPHHSTAGLCSAFNFGPNLDSNRTVLEVVQEMRRHASFRHEVTGTPNALHEAGQLKLAIGKARHLLGWNPRWDFGTTIEKTAAWYLQACACRTPGEFRALTRRQIQEFEQP